MKLVWVHKSKWDNNWAQYEARLPDRSHLTLGSYGEEEWWVNRYNCHGRTLATLLLAAGELRLDADGHPVGDDPTILMWLAEQFPLHALAALTQETT